jgi:hypothetical protein
MMAQMATHAQAELVVRLFIIPERTWYLSVVHDRPRAYLKDATYDRGYGQCSETDCAGEVSGSTTTAVP